MRILAFVRYGDLAASTRQRFIQYEPALHRAGIHLDYQVLLPNEHMKRLVAGNGMHTGSTLASYSRRLTALAKARSYDLIWLYGEFFPYLPGLAEVMAVRIAGKPIVVDIDDAFFHSYDDAERRSVRTLLGGKLRPLMARAELCCCGNDYLGDYAGRHCPRTMILPTVVDTDSYVPAAPRPEPLPLVIGWIGSPSTWPYVRPLLPILRNLYREHGITIRVVGAGAAAARDNCPELELVEWSEHREVQDVQAMHIGVMPLPDDKWARGKSGYKLIQYMACGLPVVASPVGVNNSIVRHGETGFLAATAAEWQTALTALVCDPELRRRFGRAGRTKAVTEYSLQVHAPRLIEALRSTVQADDSGRGVRAAHAGRS